MRHARALLSVSIAALGLSACSGSWLGEERMYYLKKDLGRFNNFSWNETRKTTGLDEVFPTPQEKELKAEEEICSHPNSGTRVLTQNGVTETYNYRHCVLAPYDNEGGARMSNRPDGNGTVLK